jgi:polyribonucleotide nucleotidyltransferase
MLGAVVFGHEQGKIAIAAINELVRDAGKPEWTWQPPAKDEPFIAKVTRWPKARCARPTRSAASRPARRPAARPPPA